MDGRIDGFNRNRPTYLLEIPTFYTKSLSNGHGSIMMITIRSTTACSAPHRQTTTLYWVYVNTLASQPILCLARDG
jgi:hypothetical protein